MNALQKEIQINFRSDRKPLPEQLVDMNGFDELDKEGAVNFFSAKSWTDVLNHLKSRRLDATAGADYQLEEWSVLKPSARYYYLRSYLEYLLETLSESNPDEQYVSDLFHQLYQTVYMYQVEAYNYQQKSLLRKISEHASEAIQNHKNVVDWGDSISKNIETFLSELKKYD